MMRLEDCLRLSPALLLVVSTFLASCASSGPAIEHYILPQATHAPSVEGDASTRRLKIAPLRLSGLVDRRGLLVQTSQVQVREAQNHQWADALAPLLQRSLQHYLGREATSWRIRSAGARPDEDYLLQVQVDQFHGRFDGKAVVSGHWQVFGAQRQTLAGQDFYFTHALAEDGYTALVYSLDQAWQALAGQIAKALSEIPD